MLIQWDLSLQGKRQKTMEIKLDEKFYLRIIAFIVLTFFSLISFFAHEFYNNYVDSMKLLEQHDKLLMVIRDDINDNEKAIEELKHIIWSK